MNEPVGAGLEERCCEELGVSLRVIDRAARLFKQINPPYQIIILHFGFNEKTYKIWFQAKGVSIRHNVIKRLCRQVPRPRLVCLRDVLVAPPVGRYCSWECVKGGALDAVGEGVVALEAVQVREGEHCLHGHAELRPSG